MPARCASTASRSPAGRRTGSRGWAPASCSSIRARCTGRPCWRTSSSRCCPTSSRGCSPIRPSTTRARAIAARVGLSAVLDRRPATLPFADLRKIEIAKAIARDPQVLLIDEPFAGLTSKETAAFSDLICELARRRPRRAAGRSQREERRPAGRPRDRDVCRRAHCRRHRRRGDAQRDGAARLSRRQHRDRGARRNHRSATARRRSSRSTMSASTTARRRRWRTSRSTCMPANSSRSSASTAPAKPRSSIPSRACCPIPATSAARAHRCAA